MPKVQKNFRAQDMVGAAGGKPEAAPEGGPKVEELPASKQETPVAEHEAKPRARRAPKSTKPQADVDPKEDATGVTGSSDATENKE